MNAVNDGPSTPMLLSPSSGSVLGARPGSLTVQNATDPEGDALTYTFELASDAEFTAVLVSGVDAEEGTSTTLWTPASAFCLF